MIVKGSTGSRQAGKYTGWKNKPVKTKVVEYVVTNITKYSDGRKLHFLATTGPAYRRHLCEYAPNKTTAIESVWDTYLQIMQDFPKQGRIPERKFIGRVPIYGDIGDPMILDGFCSACNKSNEVPVIDLDLCCTIDHPALVTLIDSVMDCVPQGTWIWLTLTTGGIYGHQRAMPSAQESRKFMEKLLGKTQTELLHARTYREAGLGKYTMLTMVFRKGYLRRKP